MAAMSSLSVVPDAFTAEETQAFDRDGYYICRNLIPAHYIETMRWVTQRDLRLLQGDLEFEAELNYPGAPESLDAEGGKTVRRLRQAISRDPVFCLLLKENFLLNRLKQLVGEHVVMPLSHHNCIMTKQPRFSSDTGWHQDTRYWSFTTPQLVNLWIALGPENKQNGCLQVLPGSHKQATSKELLDEDLFLRTDLPENQAVLSTAIHVELAPGDVLFFHARCFHAATRNYSSETKQSVVFTFRTLENAPLPGTRSSAMPELLLS